MATPDQIAQFKLDNWQHAFAVSQQTGVDPRIVMAQAGGGKRTGGMPLPEIMCLASRVRARRLKTH